MQFRHPEKPLRINALQGLHQIGAVISFREYGPAENYSRNLGTKAVFSFSRITLEYNEKIRQEPDRENAFAGASGGQEGSTTRLAHNEILR